MTHISFFVLFSFLLTNPTSNDSEKLLDEVRTEILSHQSINYTIKGFYPTPTGKIKTVQIQVFFAKNERSTIDYDFIVKGQISDEVQIDGIFKSVKHENKTVVLYPENNREMEKFFINKNRFIVYSPITLLRESGWEYVGNTLVDKKNLSEFYKVETDKTVNGNKIYTQVHIFLNPDSKLLDRIERRNYNNGNLAQKVVFKLEHYTFDQLGPKLTYELPTDYKSVLYGQKIDSPLPQVGEKAPVFTGEDLSGNPVNILDYRGKKILLDFSVINCGYCKLALDHFNQPDYELSDNIQAFYINPSDEQKDVADYVNKMNVQFPVIANAEEIGKLFGVSGYPTFVLIDENGLIEEVADGYDKEFLARLEDL